MKTEDNDVSEFFNRIAGEYRHKYSNEDKFHNYFFNERLEEACRNFDFGSAKILDVGAGTGNLYDFILQRYPDVDYYATDIAADMLRQSLIPHGRCYIGRLEEIDFSEETFDYVFVLGVTTYLDNKGLSRLIDRVNQLCIPGGKVIITFTNSQSLDWKTRRLLKFFPLHWFSKRYVMSQDFPVFARSVNGVRKLVPDKLVIDEVRWLNHTLFPFNQLLKRLSVSLAQRIHKQKASWVKFLSSDFLVIMSKGESIRNSTDN